MEAINQLSEEIQQDSDKLNQLFRHQETCLTIHNLVEDNLRKEVFLELNKITNFNNKIIITKIKWEWETLIRWIVMK